MKDRNATQLTNMANVIYAKLLIFNRPVQKEANLPGFHVNIACNLHFYHSFELKIILN